MKKVLMIALFAVSIQICAQFQFETANIGETTTPVSAIGIGQFASPLNFAARLHINNFYCNSAAGSLNGLLFRADGDQSVSNFWQMYTGASAASQTKRFEIEVLPDSYSVNINNNDGGIGTGEAEIQLRLEQITV